jgi:hypothetical protein
MPANYGAMLLLTPGSPGIPFPTDQSRCFEDPAPG